MPDVGSELVASVGGGIFYSMLVSKKFSVFMKQLEEEFRYLQRKKNVTKELAEPRMKVWI